MNLEDGEMLRVLWRDAHAVTDTWTAPEEIDSEPCMVWSVGFVLPDCKPGHLVLAQSVIADHGNVDHVLAIPVAMVAKMETLRSVPLIPAEPPI